MILSDTLRLALGNLRQAKLRTALTTLGVAIGIASLAGMVSLGVGLQDQFVGRFMQAGVFDSITVTSGSVNPLAAFGAGGRAGGGRGRGRGAGARGAATEGETARPEAPKAPPLDDAAIASLKSLAHVKDVFPTVRIPARIKFADFDVSTLIVGVPMSAKNEGAFRTMTAGQFFANETDDSCLLSLDMAKGITPADAQPAALVGQTLAISYTTAATSSSAAPTALPPTMLPGMPNIGAMAQVHRVDLSCTIAGIVEREPGINLGGFSLSGVMMPLAKTIAMDTNVIRSAEDLFKTSAPKARRYASLTVKVERAQFTEDVEDAIKKQGYQAFSINDALQGAKRAFIILDLVLSLIGSIALAVSSLGIMNTMVMSILERTREIGVMKAIGASDSDIRRIFLVEASAIGLLGGAAGIALGWIVGRAINFGANIYIVRQGGEAGNLFSLPLWLIAGALAFSWLISLLAGSYPANRAAKLNPIRALRHD